MFYIHLHISGHYSYYKKNIYCTVMYIYFYSCILKLLLLFMLFEPNGHEIDRLTTYLHLQTMVFTCKVYLLISYFNQEPCSLFLCCLLYDLFAIASAVQVQYIDMYLKSHGVDRKGWVPVPHPGYHY